MTLLFTFIGVVAWLAMGWVGARRTFIKFELEWGEGAASVDLLLLGLVTGPTGLIVGTWGPPYRDRQPIPTFAQVLGREPVGVHKDMYVIDHPRSKVQKLFAWGLKGLPDYDSNTPKYIARWPYIENESYNTRTARRAEYEGKFW